MTTAAPLPVTVTGEPGALATAWRLFGKGRFVVVLLWMLFGFLGFAALGSVFKPADVSKLEWVTSFLLLGIPLWLGLFVAQSVQDVESRSFFWVLPGLRAQLRHFVLAGGLVAAVVGWGVHALLGGPLPAQAGLPFALFWYSTSLADLGWVGDRRDRFMAWGGLAAAVVFLFFGNRAVLVLAEAPWLTGLGSFAAAALWWRVSGEPEVRRRRATVSNVYLSALLFDEAMLRRWWIARQAPSRRREVKWKPVVSIADRTRQLETAQHGAFPGALRGRWALMTVLVFGVGLGLVASDGWQRGGFGQGVSQLLAMIWDGGPRVGFVDRVMLVYFASVAASYVLMMGLGCPEALFRHLPMGRIERTERWVALGRRQVLGFVGTLLVGALMLMGIAAAFGTASWEKVPGVLVAVPCTLAVMPWLLLGHELLPGALHRPGKGFAIQMWRMLLMFLGIIAGILVLVFVEADFANGILVSVILAVVGDLLRSRILRRRFARLDLA